LTTNSDRDKVGGNRRKSENKATGGDMAYEAPTIRLLGTVAGLTKWWLEHRDSVNGSMTYTPDG